MRRRWLVVCFFGALAATLLLARTFTIYLVNYVICNAFLQKAPPSFPRQQVIDTFAAGLSHAQESADGAKLYLELLFSVSQALEKVQRLSSDEAGRLLEKIRSWVKSNSPEGTFLQHPASNP